jgi:hypothetical protein
VSAQSPLKNKVLPSGHQNLDKLVHNLVTSATSLTESLRTQRTHAKYINTLLELLAPNKKDQTKLRVFADELPEF